MSPVRTRCFRPVAGALLLLLTPVCVPAAPPPLDHAWELTSQLRPGEAAEIFLPLANAGSREAALGATLARFATPPFSAEKLAQTRVELRALVETNPEDETGIRARYVLGRIRQLYDPGEEPADAPELVELSRAHPSHYLAQLAVIKLVLHRLYASGPAELDAGRLSAAELAAAQVSNPGLQRDYHLVMGDAYLFFHDQQAPALRHYCAAEALGIPDAAMRATVLVQIGELARLAGETAVATSAYHKFLSEFRRDIRGFEVRKRLAGLEGQP